MEPLSDGMRQQLIEDLHRAQHGFGLAEPFTAEAHGRTPSCGDEVTVRVTVVDGELTALSWTGHGCLVSQASASALATLVPLPVTEFAELAEQFFASVEPEGQSVAALGDAEAFAGIGRFPLRARCASLAWRVTLDALGQTAQG
jgi:nitrogen fixation NifU-like protein